MDKRQQALERWIDQALSAPRGPLRPASEDASFRRYWRFPQQGRTLIAVDAPPEHEDSERFARLARAFRAAGLNAPEIIAEDHAQGFLVVSDLGSTTYLQQLSPNRADRLYRDAIAALIKLQRGLSVERLPPYDEALLRRELGLFREWLLEAFLGLDLTRSDELTLDAACSALVANALEQPKVPVHRDYHSRNLMLTAHNSPGVLDLQDTVLGPLTYDLASLLKDCYVGWPRQQVLGWVRDYGDQARRTGLPVPADQTRLVRWLDLMAAQRHLKAAGIFARLAVRDDKRGYLADLPRTLAYLEEVGALYPECSPLAAFISSRVRPRLSQVGSELGLDL